MFKGCCWWLKELVGYDVACTSSKSTSGRMPVIPAMGFKVFEFVTPAMGFKVFGFVLGGQTPQTQSQV